MGLNRPAHCAGSKLSRCIFAGSGFGIHLAHLRPLEDTSRFGMVDGSIWAGFVARTRRFRSASSEKGPGLSEKPGLVEGCHILEHGLWSMVLLPGSLWEVSLL